MENKVKRLLENPYRVFSALAVRGWFNWMPDKPYLKLMYRSQMGKKLNLKNPISFNEKLQWLKLHDRNPLYSQLVDKYAVRKHIADAVGEEYLVPLVGGPWNSFDEIDFDTLPEQFVLKCTHDSGGVVICKDKALFDKAKAKAKIERSLNRDYYLSSREWPYKDVPRRIIAEAYLVDESGVELKDYKIFCFHGKAEYVEVDFNRHIEHKLNPYDFDWNPLNFCDASKNDYSANIPKPARLENMRRIAEKISAEHRFMRVDFYSIYDRVYIGELTLYPGSGFIQFEPRSMDLKYGELLRLKED